MRSYSDSILLFSTSARFSFLVNVSKIALHLRQLESSLSRVALEFNNLLET
jgi:hypothetical protein